MSSSILHHLYTASEAEEKLGKKYFYRQRIYRLSESKKIHEFSRNNNAVYLGTHIVQAFIKELELRIQDKFPEIDFSALSIYYDVVKGKRIVVDGLFGRGISVDTTLENEEDLIRKIAGVIEWFSDGIPELILVEDADHAARLANSRGHYPTTSQEPTTNDDPLSDILPDEILWIRLDTGIIDGVEVKSYILMSLPSIAKFVGIRTDKLVEWITTTSFSDFVLSAHHKQIQGPGKPGPWKKGVSTGLTPFVPFELLPEIIVALKQSRHTPAYPEKAQLLYDMARTTLQAVGLTISGDKDKAAEELAAVGMGLGLTAADQIIGVFKQYESRDFQIRTTKEFNSKVKDMKLNYAATIGTMTFGITNRYPMQWKALGASRQLPKKMLTSSREVMRQLSPSDGVGMTFGEKHFTKDPRIDEAIKTGKQGKEFYERLKKVGLLD